MSFKNLTLSKKIAVLAACSSMITVATIVIKIPALAGGYINFGDSFIFIFAYLFGPLCAFIAGGLGSASADLLTGYIVWAPFTLVIKAVEGFICGYLCQKLAQKQKSNMLGASVCFSVSALVMVILYYFAAAILVGSLKGALVSFGENFLQGGVSIVIAIVVLFVFKFKNFRLS